MRQYEALSREEPPESSDEEMSDDEDLLAGVGTGKLRRRRMGSALPTQQELQHEEEEKAIANQFRRHLDNPGITIEKSIPTEAAKLVGDEVRSHFNSHFDLA